LQQTLNYLFSLGAEIGSVTEFTLLDEAVELIHVVGLEGHRTVQHGVEKYAETPHVHKKPLVAFVSDQFWGNVSWGATLLFHNLPFPSNFRNSEITEFNPTFSIKQNIVKLDVPVEHRSTMAVSETVNNLFEDVLNVGLGEGVYTLDEVKEVAAVRLLHYKEHVFW